MEIRKTHGTVALGRAAVQQNKTNHGAFRNRGIILRFVQFAASAWLMSARFVVVPAAFGMPWPALGGGRLATGHITGEDDVVGVWPKCA